MKSFLCFKKKTSNLDSLNEDKNIFYYQNEALSLMEIFKIDEENFFPLWLNKFEYVANLIEVPQSKMGELFVSMLQVDLQDPTDKHFEFIDILKHSYDHTLTDFSHNMIELQFHRSRFNSRVQYVGEPILKYADNLRKIYNKCNYATDEEINLCHRFLKGIRDDDIRTFLERYSNLSFNDYVEKAFEFAKSNKITHYLNQALSMINIYSEKKKATFYVWLNKFEYVANVIEVPDDRMIEFFKNMVDNDVHQSVKDKFSSVKISDKSYDKLVNFYLLYFKPSYESDLHRKRFMCRNQYDQETIKNYANSLRKIFNKCNFLDRSEEILCTQFLSGILDNDIRTYLSDTLYLSFEEMIDKTIVFIKDHQTDYYLNQALSMISVFKINQEVPFLSWLTKFEEVANKIKIPFQKKGQLFLKMVHDDVQKFVNNNSETLEFFELPYDQILDKYRQYLSFGIEKFNSHKSTFNNRKQYAPISITEYPDSSDKIDFNRLSLYDHEQNLSEQFINELDDEKERTFLNDYPGMSYDELLAMAVEFEKDNNISNYLSPALKMIHIFNPEKEGEFYEWLNKFEYVANLVDVPDKKMIEFFNEMVNTDTHKIVKEKFSTVKFDELTYNQTIYYYLRYHAPSYERDVHSKRYKYRNQYEKETICDYLKNLRKIHDNCGYTYPPKEDLRERFLNGIRDDDVRSYLLQFSDISVSEMLTKAIAFEKANDITCYINQALSMMNIYNPQKEGDFHIWLNKFEFVGDFIRIPNYLMGRFFKKMVDYDLQTEIKQMFPCVHYCGKSYEELIGLFLRFFCYLYESHFYSTRFFCRKQYEKETIEKYAESLRNLYDKIDDKRRMNEELCNQFIVGIFDDDIRTHLNKTPYLSFDEMVEKAIEFKKNLDISDYFNKALTKINIYATTTKVTFYEWVNKFEFIADIIKVPVEDMSRLFDKMVDNGIHTSVKEANPTVNFSALSYKEKISYYLRHIYSICEGNAYRKRFVSRRQYENETIEQYANTLQKLIEECNYNNDIQKRLCKQFLCGIREDIKMDLNKITPTSSVGLIAKAIELENNHIFHKVN